MKERKPNLREIFQEGTLSLADSESPENQILAGLRMIGGIEESGEGNGLGFKVTRKLTVLLAKSRLWTDEQISEAIDEGRRIERMANQE